MNRSHKEYLEKSLSYLCFWLYTENEATILLENSIRWGAGPLWIAVNSCNLTIKSSLASDLYKSPKRAASQPGTLAPVVYCGIHFATIISWKWKQVILTICNRRRFVELDFGFRVWGSRMYQWTGANGKRVLLLDNIPISSARLPIWYASLPD